MARPAHVNAYHRAWCRANRDKTAAYNRKWLSLNPHKLAQYRETARQRYIGKARGLKLLARYSLTEAQWEAMFQQQGGGCAICGRISKNPGKNRKPLVVDHSHSTGKVRGLLCHNCNLTLGKYDDNPELFEKIAAYLKKHATE